MGKFELIAKGSFQMKDIKQTELKIDLYFNDIIVGNLLIDVKLD